MTNLRHQLRLEGLKLELAAMKVAVHAAKYPTSTDYPAHMERLRDAVRE